jgi:hypothetical protein
VKLEILAVDRTPAVTARPVKRARWSALMPIAILRVPPIGVKIEAMIVEGECMAPYLLPGDVVALARGLEPRPGDLALVRMSYARAPQIIGRAPLIVERAALKQVQVIDGQTWLCAAEGAVPADLHVIEGTAVAVQRRPSWRAWRCFKAPLRKLQFMPPPA